MLACQTMLSFLFPKPKLYRSVFGSTASYCAVSILLMMIAKLSRRHFATDDDLGCLVWFFLLSLSCQRILLTYLLRHHLTLDTLPCSLPLLHNDTLLIALKIRCSLGWKAPTSGYRSLSLLFRFCSICKKSRPNALCFSLVFFFFYFLLLNSCRAF